MRILITNDDGIAAPGILKLAELASDMGDVYIVAPDRQNSAMSQKVTISGAVKIAEYDFPFPVKGAWSIGGTPADCVKAALRYIMPSALPDVVFSGINDGFNTGFDNCYSGTVGAAMEGFLNGIPAIAFSAGSGDDLRIAGQYLKKIAEELVKKPLADGIWNVNFPSCNPAECRGIRSGTVPAPYQMYRDTLVKVDGGKGYDMVEMRCVCPRLEDICDGNNDIQAVLSNYISVGRLRCMVM